MSRAKKILIFQTAFLGDVVLTLPLVELCRRCYPEASISMVVRADLAPVVAADSRLEEVIADDKRGRTKGIIGFARMARRLRKKKYDAVFCPHPSHRSSLLLKATGIPERVGFYESGFSFLYTRCVNRRSDYHQARRIISLLSDSPPPIPKATVPPRGLNNAERLLREAGITVGTKAVALAPGSIWPTKRWPARGFASAAKLLLQEGIIPVVVGTSSEKNQARIIADGAEGVINLVGKTNLETFMGVLALVDGVIANDSGAGHLAAAVKKPVVSLFGPTVPAQGFVPLGDKIRVVEVALPCRPCSPHGTHQCPKGHFACMNSIDPRKVAVTLMGVLDEV